MSKVIYSSEVKKAERKERESRKRYHVYYDSPYLGEARLRGQYQYKWVARLIAWTWENTYDVTIYDTKED